MSDDNAFARSRAQERARTLAEVVAWHRVAVLHAETRERHEVVTAHEEAIVHFESLMAGEGDNLRGKKPLIDRAFEREMIIRDIVDLAEAVITTLDVKDHKITNVKVKDLGYLINKAKNTRGFYAHEARRS